MCNRLAAVVEPGLPIIPEAPSLMESCCKAVPKSPSNNCRTCSKWVMFAGATWATRSAMGSCNTSASVALTKAGVVLSESPTRCHVVKSYGGCDPAHAHVACCPPWTTTKNPPLVFSFLLLLYVKFNSPAVVLTAKYKTAPSFRKSPQISVSPTAASFKLAVGCTRSATSSPASNHPTARATPTTVSVVAAPTTAPSSKIQCQRCLGLPKQICHWWLKTSPTPLAFASQHLSTS
mmetsp:Transcript_79327/g.157141  ORF Transcript_79327/g.157141 Transcript_79327/m.157141 type:complete len:234 (+) Transcript_79327:737-1438(+)